MVRLLDLQFVADGKIVKMCTQNMTQSKLRHVIRCSKQHTEQNTRPRSSFCPIFPCCVSKSSQFVHHGHYHHQCIDFVTWPTTMIAEEQCKNWIVFFFFVFLILFGARVAWRSATQLTCIDGGGDGGGGDYDDGDIYRWEFYSFFCVRLSDAVLCRHPFAYVCSLFTHNNNNNKKSPTTSPASIYANRKIACDLFVGKFTCARQKISPIHRSSFVLMVTEAAFARAFTKRSISQRNRSRVHARAPVSFNHLCDQSHIFILPRTILFRSLVPYAYCNALRVKLNEEAKK